ncbi:MAG TPA: tetratricopeptide repeat protein [Planctomycetes bacterium]|nr:tetratricopeptide repeat protein [Planctomycetota bacterium]HIK60463.1 tetratricopeptide repeat protein [Planctomycetota bacterium]
MSTARVESSPKKERRGGTPRAFLALVLLVAALLRVSYFFERDASMDLRQPTVDAGFHDDWARSLAFGSEGASDWRPTHYADPHFDSSPYLRPPGFPYLLAGIYRMSGGSHLAAVAVQMILGCLSVWLLFSLVCRALGPGAALVAALLLGCHWAPIYFEGELHAPALLIALELAFAFCLLRYHEARKRSWLVGAALALGLAVLTRPNALLYLPAACLWLAWVGKRSARAWGRDALWLCAGVLLTVLPATLRNRAASGQWVPVTTNFGINLYLGNHAGADGLIREDPAGIATFKTCYDYPSLMARLETRLGPGASHGDVSDWFADQAWGWIWDHPAEFVALTWRKLRWTLGPMEVGHNKEVALERRASPVLRYLPTPFPWMLGLASLGCLLHGLGRRGAGLDGAREEEARRRHELAALALSLFAAYVVSLLPFFAAARYRVPALPWLALLASLSVPMLRLQRSRGLMALGGACALVVLCTWGAPQVSQTGEKWHVERAIAQSLAGHPEAARVELELALEINPSSLRALYELALLEHSQGHKAKARQLYERVLRNNPTHHLALFNVATLQREAGDLDGALSRFEEAEAASPMFAPALFNQGLLHLNGGRMQKAARCLERAIQLERPAQRLLQEAERILGQALPEARQAGLNVAPLEDLLQRLRTPR